MLLHQGVPAWKLWFGVEPTVTPELQDLMERSIVGNWGAGHSIGETGFQC